MGTRTRFVTTSRLGAGGVLALALTGTAIAQVTTRVSLASSGVQGNDASGSPAISPDGRFVAFTSWATNLVVGDTNLMSDAFVHDRQTGTTERVSVDSSEAEADSNTFGRPAITPDGRYVAFVSPASNLVSGDTNAVHDVFVRDRQSGTTERVNVDSNGAEADADSGGSVAISSDGRYVLFSSDATNLVPGGTIGWANVYLRDRQSGTTEIVSVTPGGFEGDSASGGAIAMSPDARYVAFGSFASDLVAGDTNVNWDAFVRDRQTGTTERVSIHTNGTQGNHVSGEFDVSISADGRYVAFPSLANNLVNGDTNGTYDVFLRDRQSGTTERVSIHSSGAQSTGGYSYQSAISADGRYVTFASSATNLVAGDTNTDWDIFLRDRQAGTTERISVSSSGAQGTGDSGNYHSISADGRYVAFESGASNLVSGDTNAAGDVFIRDRAYDPMTSLCEAGIGGVIECPCANPPNGAGRGCNNSSNTGGAILSASGGAFISQDAVVFTTSGENPTALSIVLQGTALVPNGQVLGTGVHCAGGTIERLYTKLASAGSMTAPNVGMGDPTVSARSAAVGDTILPGQSRWYVVSYREPVTLRGCHGGKGNPIDPLAEIRMNATQTGEITWSP